MTVGLCNLLSRLHTDLARALESLKKVKKRGQSLDISDTAEIVAQHFQGRTPL